MNVLMLTKSRFRDDVRVRREAEALVEAGHCVSVIALDADSFTSNAVSVIGLGEVTGLRRSKMRRSSPVHRVIRWMFLPEHRRRAIRQFQRRATEAARTVEPVPDVIHAHDFPALEPAAIIAAATGAALVYDSHEFWSGMPSYGRPEPFRHRLTLAREARLAHRADAVISVSDGCAALLRHRLRLPAVEVIRNTFPSRVDLALPDRPSGIVYAGRIGPGRDLQTAFSSSVFHTQDLQLHLMGPVDEEWPVPEHVVLHDPGSMDEVDRLLARTGIALVSLERGPVNHDVALPNKVFQAVAVGVPVVAADLPELATLVKGYRLGTLYQPGDADSLAEAVAALLNDYPTYRTTVAEARSELNWAVDGSRLLRIYESLDPSTDSAGDRPSPLR